MKCSRQRLELMAWIATNTRHNAASVCSVSDLAVFTSRHAAVTLRRTPEPRDFPSVTAVTITTTPCARRAPLALHTAASPTHNPVLIKHRT
ncbi:hypothetical protein EYF80_034229 [Liparis tanakae]|uniref:Uncharacterized protein n=1 Tax=Liparis tanakae TaxID=230148 RepID=A0A4Z2GQJ1_9TELE|nr:hypothetical protein EYF80_034229 [Liparis tanakae]